MKNYSTDHTSKDDGDLFLQSLRAATAPMHVKLEGHALSKSLFRPGITLGEYGLYLVCMKPVVERYDKEVLPFLKNIIPDVEDRRKGSFIESDIEYLKSKNVFLPDEEKFFLPTLSSNNFALGIAYVIEGSTLGGRVIIKNLQSRLPITADEGARFFAGYGSKTGQYWKQFLDALTSFATINNGQADVIVGAQACFNAIYNHFDKTYTLNEV